jgi:NAD(P)-dependent dehydrogenase (short-subunit alcohol dehydrogenase family)
MADVQKGREFADRVIAITGAASGIGRALALELGRRGADLALGDVDEAGLEETVRRAKLLGRRVEATRVDVADREAVEAWAVATREAFEGRVDGIVNNAGVALGGTFLEVTYEDLDWLLGINLWGVIHGTKAFLPTLVERGDGWVVNVSSVFGLVGVPGQAAYNMAKFGVRGLTECLWSELDGTGVTPISVHPGGIKTNIVRNSRVADAATHLTDLESAAREFDEKLARTTAEQAARIIAKGMIQRKPRVLVGPDAFLIEGISRAFPTGYATVLRRTFPATEAIET